MYEANKVIIPATVWNANVTSTVFPAGQYSKVGMQIIWTSLTGTLDGSVVLQVSNDGTNFDNAHTPVVVSGASGNDAVALDNIFFAYYRVVATKNNVTGGTVAVICTLKE
jgi:hypothetical protein